MFLCFPPILLLIVNNRAGNAKAKPPVNGGSNTKNEKATCDFRVSVAHIMLYGRRQNKLPVCVSYCGSSMVTL